MDTFPLLNGTNYCEDSDDCGDDGFCTFDDENDGFCTYCTELGDLSCEEAAVSSGLDEDECTSICEGRTLHSFELIYKQGI